MYVFWVFLVISGILDFVCDITIGPIYNFAFPDAKASCARVMEVMGYLTIFALVPALKNE